MHSILDQVIQILIPERKKKINTFTFFESCKSYIYDYEWSKTFFLRALDYLSSVNEEIKNEA